MIAILADKVQIPGLHTKLLSDGQIADRNAAIKCYLSSHDLKVKSSDLCIAFKKELVPTI